MGIQGQNGEAICVKPWHVRLTIQCWNKPEFSLVWCFCFTHLSTAGGLPNGTYQFNTGETHFGNCSLTCLSESNTDASSVINHEWSSSRSSPRIRSRTKSPVMAISPQMPQCSHRPTATDDAAHQGLCLNNTFPSSNMSHKDKCNQNSFLF